MSKYKNNVTYYQDALARKMNINIKHISNDSKTPEKLTKQENLLHQWYINELNQERDVIL